MAKKKTKQTLSVGLKHFMMLIGLFLVCLTLFLGIQQKEERLVSEINISIDSIEDGKNLISSEDVYNIIQQYTGFDIDRAALKNFNPDKIETLLNRDKRIKSANVYFGKHGKMYVEVEQRKPIVRVDVTGGEDFYLDKEGAHIPVLNSSILRVPVATGNISAYTKDYKELLNNSLKDVFVIANKLEEDPFLKSLIEQIHISPDNEIVLAPKLGRNKIILGSSLALETKLNKLKLYYKEGVKRVGLDRFSEINLRYEGQIVGIK